VENRKPQEIYEAVHLLPWRLSVTFSCKLYIILPTNAQLLPHEVTSSGHELSDSSVTRSKTELVLGSMQETRVWALPSER
jgi:hypothetical protein